MAVDLRLLYEKSDDYLEDEAVGGLSSTPTICRGHFCPR